MCWQAPRLLARIPALHVHNTCRQRTSKFQSCTRVRCSGVPFICRCTRLRCPPACWFPIRVIITPYRFIPWPLWPMLKHCWPDNIARGHLSLLHRVRCSGVPFIWRVRCSGVPFIWRIRCSGVSFTRVRRSGVPFICRVRGSGVPFTGQMFWRQILMTHVIALEAGQYSQGTSEPITPVMHPWQIICVNYIIPRISRLEK